MAFRLPYEKSALVMIDMQRDFIQKGGYGYLQCNSDEIFNEVAKIIEPCKKVLEAARKLGMTVIHTREGHETDLRDLAPSKKSRQYIAKPENYDFLIGDEGPMGKLLVRGEYGHDIVDDLQPIHGEIVIDKPGKGTFYNTDIHQVLVTRGITHLVLCGVTTECCVNTTFREANDHGFECCTLMDCTNGFNEEIVKHTINTFCAYDGLLGYIGKGEQLVELAAQREPGSLGEVKQFGEFMGYDIDTGSAVVELLIASGGEYMGETEDIDEALNTVSLVISVDDSTLESKNIVFTPSSGMVSMSGTIHTMFGSIGFISKDISLIRHYFVTQRGYDPEDELSKHHREYPMKPVDYRGIEDHFFFAIKGELEVPFPESRRTFFDWQLFDKVYELKDLLIQELHQIGKCSATPSLAPRYIQLLQIRQQIINLLQPTGSPHLLIIEASPMHHVIVRLLGFPSITANGLIYVAEFGLDGCLLDICHSL